MKEIEEFLDEAYEIEISLQKLSNQYADLYETLRGDLFRNQNQIAADFENAIISLTHETASMIGFERIRILTIAKYVDFRKKCYYFTDEQLLKAIDGELNASTKLEWANQMFEGNTKLILEQINDIKENWNDTFSNKSYIKVKMEMNLTMHKNESKN